jgi:molybdopterin-guanine dinucleotide biosynthesis protein A
MQTQFDVVILAGQDPRRPDPLASMHGVAHKVLIPIDGRPMIWHVVDALAGSERIGRVVVVGLGAEAGVAFSRPVDFLPDQGSLLSNVVHGFSCLAAHGSPQRYALLTTGDIPLIRAEIIDWFIEACQPLDKDVYWGIVERRTMEALFPKSKRTYLRLVEGDFCSGDLYLGKIQAALGRQTILRQLVEHRKSILQQLRLLGPGVVLKFLLRRLRLADLLQLLQRLLELRGQTVILPFAEAGMDVDKPHQLEQVLAHLRQHPRPWPHGQSSSHQPSSYV